MADLKPIPRPAKQYWRDFRFHVVPLLVFAATCVAVVLMWAYNVSPPTLVGQVESRVAAVTSQDSGVITNLFVTRFQSVKMGEPLAEIISMDGFPAPQQIIGRLQRWQMKNITEISSNFCIIIYFIIVPCSFTMIDSSLIAGT